MIIERLTTINQLHSLEPEWRLLESHMLPMPFTTYDWAVAWWRCLRCDRTLVRDHLHFLSFRNDHGELLGIAPLIVTHRPAIGPLRIRQLQYIGADTNITELRCVAVATKHTNAVHDALIDYLATSAPAYDWLQFTGVARADQILRITQRFGSPAWQRQVPDFLVSLKPTWDEFRQALPRNIKESLRKCYNAPHRDGIDLQFTVVEAGTDVKHAVDEMLRLHTARAQLSHTVTHPNVFSSAAARDFLHEICSRFSVSNRLRIFQIKHNEKIVATRIGFVCNDHLYLYYSGFDPQYAKYSVMTRVVAEAIKYAIENQFAAVNLSIGRDVSKERWRPEEINYHDIEVIAPSKLSAAKYRLASVTGTKLKHSWVGKWLRRGVLGIGGFCLKLLTDTDSCTSLLLSINC